MRRIWAASLVFLVISAPAWAQTVELPLIRVQRLSSEVVLDGRVDETAWNGIEPFRMVVQSPTYRTPLSEETEIRVAYDDEYLYFSCRCLDSAAESIQTTGYKRDAWSSAFDQIGLVIDTFDDNENALVFVISSLGVRVDVAVFNDGNITANDFPMNLSWDTYWDVETMVTDEGWFAEARIPFSSLKFNSDGDGVSMGLIAYRYITRHREIQVYPDIPPDWGFTSFIKPSRAQPVLFKGIRPRKPLYITPYVLGGIAQNFELNGTETAYERDENFTRDLGLDLKYGVTNNLTLDLTVNTDFAQVEADDEQVNLTRFSLFFPEKRRFFQERSSNFDFKLGDFDQVFYSRRIGLDEDAEERIPLLGGLRVVGRIGAWDVGLMNMQSARNDIRPSENYGVLRLRRQILNPFSYVGGIVTSQISEDGTYNTVVGTDGIFRLFGEDFLLLNFAQSFEKDGATGLNAARLRALWEKRRYRGLSYAVTFARAGEDYNPALGFEQREDFSQFSQQVAHGWIPGEESPFSQHQIIVRSDWFVRNLDRNTDTHNLVAEWSGFSKGGAVVGVAIQRTYEALTESFELSDDVEVEIGEYSFAEVELTMQTSESRSVYSANTLNIGSFYGGGRISIEIQPTWNVSRFINFTGAYQYDRVSFSDRDLVFNAHVARFRTELTLNRSVSASAFVQYNGVDDISLANFRLRFNPREGNDLYVVYNEGFNLDRFSETPRLPRSDGRTLVVKYSHTFLQ